MKVVFLCVSIVLVFLSMASGQAKILTNDPLTGLPLIPPTESQKMFGNAPNPLPDTGVCKSKMQGNSYTPFNISDHFRQSDAIAWYSSRLSGFKKTESSDQKQTIFYKPDGTLVVILISLPNKDGVSIAQKVTYEKFVPGLAEKTILGIPQRQSVCP